MLSKLVNDQHFLTTVKGGIFGDINFFAIPVCLLPLTVLQDQYKQTQIDINYRGANHFVSGFATNLYLLIPYCRPDTMPPIDGQPQGPPQAGAGTIQLSTLIDFSIQRTYHELTVLSEL